MERPGRRVKNVRVSRSSSGPSSALGLSSGECPECHDSTRYPVVVTVSVSAEGETLTRGTEVRTTRELGENRVLDLTKILRLVK